MGKPNVIDLLRERDLLTRRLSHIDSAIDKYSEYYGHKEYHKAFRTKVSSFKLKHILLAILHQHPNGLSLTQIRDRIVADINPQLVRYHLSSLVKINLISEYNANSWRLSPPTLINPSQNRLYKRATGYKRLLIFHTLITTNNSQS